MKNNQLESSSTSYCSGSTSGVSVYQKDEHLKLASHNPKKRAGRIKFKETRHPVYRGVRERNHGKWVCEVREPNKKTRVWLGTYPTAEMAARAHDVAVLAMRGRSACLNFADSVWRLHVPQSSNVKDIQIAAAMAAEAFGQMEDTVEETTSNHSEDISNKIFDVPYFADMSSTTHEIYRRHGVVEIRLVAQNFISCSEMVETNELPEVVIYADEEEMFRMPELIASMAEGLMVPPPQTVGYANFADNADICVDYSLWNL